MTARTAAAVLTVATALAVPLLAPATVAAGQPAQAVGATAPLSLEGAVALPETSATTAPAPTATPVPAVPGNPGPAGPPDARMSNERTFTTWAHPAEAQPAYAYPSVNARRVARLHMYTEDGFPEVYLLLRSHTAADGTAWVMLRIPGRPNGRTAWVRREALGAFHLTRWRLVIDRGARRLTAYFDGRRRFTAPVGVGKPSSPTPPGRFWIRERFRLTSRSSPYWPYALGTSDYSTLTDWPGGGVVGIHGDFGSPQLIPGDPSHGCVRMHDSDLAWLAPRLTLGTPVRIL